MEKHTTFANQNDLGKNIRLAFFLLFFLIKASLTYAMSNDLPAILQSGTLRIGSTGDYPPLTMLDVKTGHFDGTEIKLARQFAAYLHVQPKLIKTTWPTLSHDLQIGKFDIAVGGISDSKERAQLFFFSNSIGHSGKIPLVRCQDVSKYQTIAQINQSNVIVVENSGGTNWLFAKQYLSKAKLVTVSNNEDTFAYLLKNKADVMITDSIEAVYRHTVMPTLCSIHPTQPFSHDNKVFLLSKQSPQLLKVLNEWLSKKTRSDI